MAISTFEQDLPRPPRRSSSHKAMPVSPRPTLSVWRLQKEALAPSRHSKVVFQYGPIQPLTRSAPPPCDLARPHQLRPCRQRLTSRLQAMPKAGITPVAGWGHTAARHPPTVTQERVGARGFAVGDCQTIATGLRGKGSIGDYAAASAAVECIAPKRLDRVNATVGHGDIGGSALP